MKRFLVWSMIVLPPVLLMFLSLKPLEIIALRLFSFVAIVWLVTISTALAWRSTFKPQKYRRRAVVISLIAVVSIALFNWPLRIAYSVSRSDFEQVAEQVAMGKISKTPRRIGWFWIEGIDRPELAVNQRDRQGLRLWTNLHENGNTGFVRSAPDNLRLNLWSHFKLDETWQFVSED